MKGKKTKNSKFKTMEKKIREKNNKKYRYTSMLSIQCRLVC